MWFKRSDGVLMFAEEGSASFGLMSKDGSFEIVEESSANTTSNEGNPLNTSKKVTPKPAPKNPRRKKKTD